MTNTTNTTLSVGDRVHTPNAFGDDYDAGIIHTIDGDRAFVGWDSGSGTFIALDELELLEPTPYR